ncbi:MAG: hypothetical protein EOO24_13915, partial [Comamonadaceae bacterium]
MTPTLDLALQFGDFPDAAAHRKLLGRARVRKWMEFALQRPAEISVRIVGAEISAGRCKANSIHL